MSEQEKIAEQKALHILEESGQKHIIEEYKNEAKYTAEQRKEFVQEVLHNLRKY